MTHDHLSLDAITDIEGIRVGHWSDTDAATGWVLMVGGGVVAAVGVVLIAMRARLKADPQG